MSEPLYRVSISTPDAAPVAVTQLRPPAQTGHASPWFLPDGRHFLYRVDGDAEGIYVGTLGSLDRGTDGGRDILVLETTRGGATRLTDDPRDELSPVWSHDGRRIAFNSNREGAFLIFEGAANGSGTDKVLLPSSQAVLVPEDWSDTFLLYRKVDAQTRRDLWAVPVSAAGSGQPVPVANTRFDEREGQFSPNGKWIAYASNRMGRSEIYAQPFPGTEGAKPVSSGGGSQPRWRSDGKELFYIGLDNRLMAVTTTFGSDGHSLQLGSPAALFASRIADSGPARTHLYAVASDGQRFLIGRPLTKVPPH